MTPSLPPSLSRRAVAEALGTLLLLAVVVGSGIMADRLSAGNTGLALLANSLATGAGLLAILLTFGPVSGAHLNPAVTLALAAEGQMVWAEVPTYLAAQIAGGFAGVAVAHGMFGHAAFAVSIHARSGASQCWSEFVATFGLLAVVRSCSRTQPQIVPLAVAAYITSAYWFTASTSFANPAVTLARMATDTFTGIRPADAPGFLVAQFAGAAAAVVLFRWLLPQRQPA
ncbi:MAG: aquaporin family protein [Acidobacteriota bacterium]|nr:aquaporin family protein [Acidobacteriota bacterium]